MIDQKAVVICESKQGDFTFQYHMPLGASWDAALKAASEIFAGLQEHIKKLEEEAKAKQAEPVEVAAEVVLRQAQDDRSEQEKEA